MKRRWLLIGSVVAVTAVIDLVIIPWVGPWHDVPDWLGFTMFAMAPCHGSLLAVWIALGGRATPWRLVAAVLGVAGWLWVLNWFPDSDGYSRITQLELLTVILAAEMFLLSGLLMLARLLGLELTNTLRGGRPSGPLVLARPSGLEPDDASHGDPTQAVADDDGQWVQFSLRTLMSWTTAVAVLLSTLRYCPWRLVEDVFRDPSILAAILGGSVITALGALWIALGVRWPVVRIVVLAVTSIAGVAILQLTVGSGEDLGGIVTFFVAQAVYLVVLLWLVRLAGYRLVWRRRVRL